MPPPHPEAAGLAFLGLPKLAPSAPGSAGHGGEGCEWLEGARWTQGSLLCSVLGALPTGTPAPRRGSAVTPAPRQGSATTAEEERAQVQRQPWRWFLCWQREGTLGGCGQGGTGDPKPRELRPPPHGESVPMSPRMGGDHCADSSIDVHSFPGGLQAPASEPHPPPRGQLDVWRHVTVLCACAPSARVPGSCPLWARVPPAPGRAESQRLGDCAGCSVTLGLVPLGVRTSVALWGGAMAMLRDRAGAQQVGGKELGKAQPRAAALEHVTRSIQTYEERERQFVQKRTCDSGSA